MIRAALREASDGILIAVYGRPGARSTRVTGYNESRRAVSLDGAAPPKRGAANREVERFLARLAGAVRHARIVREPSSRREVALVGGADALVAVTKFAARR